ncbi:hypothetical protein CCACVL1_25116 [Corchorus capsularis]|uniref:Uncharacterized protein n=1 Tax=Corchorus capsularis TaxID=210143 RepID=A0A1R3GM29_COCAP|nr:hypothetical protein CCACVL1_25116 [Corchorus capsularis]
MAMPILLVAMVTPPTAARLDCVLEGETCDMMRPPYGVPQRFCCESFHCVPTEDFIFGKYLRV